MARTTVAARTNPANDNHALTSHREVSSRAAYLKGGKNGGSTVVEFLRLSLAAAAACGLAVEDRLTAKPLDGGGVLLVKDPQGGALTKNGGRLLLRVLGLSEATRSARPVTLRRTAEGVVVSDADLPPVFPFLRLPGDFLAEFRSLGSDKAGVDRRNFLAANSNGQTEKKKTTKAGDECYTPGFFVKIVLAAARRDRFDLDVCSMANDGAYVVDPTTIRTKWGQTPKRFRCAGEVVQPVPAEHYMTAAEEFGSLLYAWTAELVWLNPPYGQRAWAAFLEKAQREVACGNAGIVVALVPSDNAGKHSEHLYGDDAYRIELSRQLPFYKPELKTISTIRNSQVVVFGRGPKTLAFLLRLLQGLEDIGYITEAHHRYHRRIFNHMPQLRAAA